MIYKFDNTHVPVARYDFDGDLLDASGNDLHLTGTGVAFRPVHGRTLGLTAGTAARTVTDALLSIPGDCTVQLLLMGRATPAAAELVRFAGAGDTQSTNYQYSVALTTPDQVRWLTEHGAGVNDDLTVAASPSLPGPHVPWHLAAVRQANVVQLYVNGVVWGAPSAALTTPDGGTTAKLELRASGTGHPDMLGLKICASALTPAEIRHEYNRTIGQEFGMLEPARVWSWSGAITTDGATVVLKLTHESDDVRLVVDGVAGDPVATVNGVARLAVEGLAADTYCAYWFEVDGDELPGEWYFLTAPTGSASFTVAFAGDASNGSQHEVFEAIRLEDPLLFLHLGDAHYSNITSNSPALYRAAYDEWLVTQDDLPPTAYVWDDHDYGANNSDGGSAGKPAAAAVYRECVPHYPLSDATGIWQTFDIGRVRFVITDQRSAATANSATDNASKTMLGATQKAWFKDLISNSSGMLIVWVCPRAFGGVASAGADHWGGFTTERTELGAYINANAPGRVIVLSADAHALGIDDGTNHTYGGEPLPTFQAAPLDRTPDSTIYGSAVYSEGWFNANGQFGTMAIEDSGGATIDVTWRGFDSASNELTSLTFSVDLS